MKLIIFDFDGVLRSMSWEYLYDAYWKLTLAMGKNPDAFFPNIASFKKWFDNDWHKNEMRIMGDEKYVPRPEFNKIFHQHFDANLKMFPWVPETLSHLSKKHILVILSSSTKESVQKALGDLSRYFFHIIGAEEVTKLKPNPEGVFLALKITNTLASEAIMIGDMHVDYHAGKSANVKTGLVKWGFGEWENLVALKPNYLFEKPEDLLSL
jgi:HAD superfamily hydrolase (TIGR01549 family)